MPPRFLLDEHVNPAIQRQLQRHSLEIIVRRVGEPDVPSKGTPDRDLLRWAADHRFVLVSEDRSMLPDCLRECIADGRHSYGILWIRPGARLGRLIEELYLLWQICDEAEFLDRGVDIHSWHHDPYKFGWRLPHGWRRRYVTPEAMTHENDFAPS